MIAAPIRIFLFDGVIKRASFKLHVSPLRKFYAIPPHAPDWVASRSQNFSTSDKMPPAEMRKLCLGSRRGQHGLLGQKATDLSL